MGPTENWGTKRKSIAGKIEENLKEGRGRSKGKRQAPLHQKNVFHRKQVGAS